MKLRIFSTPFLAGVLLSAFVVWKAGEARAIEPDEAATIARQGSEAVAFLSLFDGKFKDCVEEKTIEACKSDWVTCLEDGWVVQFSYKESCGIANDGRLQLTVVIDGNGKIISRFPEEMYFRSPQHCLEDYDCLTVLPSQCLNFIYAPFYEVSYEEKRCSCQKGRCGLRRVQ